MIASRYEVTAAIGRGGMGEVWAGYDTRLDRRVALKLLRPDFVPAGSQGRSAIARFKREARLTARLEHPGVPAVFDVGADGDVLYIAMQLVDGKDLSDVLDGMGALPIEWAVAIGAQIAAVLAAAHAVSLVHRDLKPRNVMLARGGTVRVLDFGVAALLDPEITRVTAAGETVGSPAYMAPEQLTSATASPRTDLYALGCVLHEILAGEEVFAAATPAAQMYAHLEREPVPLRSLRDDVPEAVEHLVLDLLAKDPEARPPDAAEVYQRLRPLLPLPDARGVAEDPLDPTSPYRRPLAPAPRRRHQPVAPDAANVPLEQIRAEAVELAEQGRFTQAAELLDRRLRRALEPAAQLRGTRLQLANTLLLGGEFARAQPEFQALVTELTALRGAGDEDVLRCRMQVATCRAELGDLSAAVDELTDVLDLVRVERGATDPEVVNLRRQVALLLASSGALEEASRALRGLLADLEETVGEDHMTARDIAELLERVDRGRGRRRNQ
ncbi:serine/threonine-protein kinase [Pseudonocardia aurantiaca]|uniref:non-specific serine/threonine protein kinase n=1 Tax=Pseudonocardia aurantiaca TaxID=75290 RepID=A0ABW4FMU4_9PSEU